MRRMPSRMSSGSKPVTTIGTPNRSASAGVLAHPHHRAHVPGREERLHPAHRRGHDRLDRRWHADVADQQAEVLDAELLGLVDRHRVGRRGGLEADAEEDHLLVGVVPREVERVERRVDDAHVAAGALDPEQVLLAAGHAQHVAERAEDHVGPRRDLQRLVDDLERGDADRAAGSVDQLDAVGQQLVEAVPDDRVGLAAADLHHRPGVLGRGVDVVEQPLGQRGVLELVEVLHRSVSFRVVRGRHDRCEVGSRQPGLLGRHAPVVAELGVELAHLPEELERLQRRLLVEALQGEADVDDRVLADLEVGHVLQAHLLGHAAEVHLRDPRPVALRRSPGPVLDG